MIRCSRRSRSPACAGTVNVGLLEDEGLTAGDWVLIHVGFALSKIGEDEAQDQLRLLTAIGEATLAMEEVTGYAFAPDAEERR